MATVSVSLPSDGDTIDASDYNTPITTIVNEINGELDNANIASDAAIALSKISLGSDSAGGIWWEEIGRTTLGSAGDTITVSSLPARKYLRVLISAINSGEIRTDYTFNNDTGSNYARRFVNDMSGSAGTTQTSQSSLVGNSTSATQYTTLEILNVATERKIVQQVMVSETAPPDSKQQYGVWTNTSDAISRIDVTNGGAGDFASGSEIVVLGHD